MSLEIPHPRIPERDFVLYPLLEVVGEDYCHPVLNKTVGSLLEHYWESIDGDHVLP